MATNGIVIDDVGRVPKGVKPFHNFNERGMVVYLHPARSVLSVRKRIDFLIKAVTTKKTPLLKNMREGAPKFGI